MLAQTFGAPFRESRRICVEVAMTRTTISRRTVLQGVASAALARQVAHAQEATPAAVPLAGTNLVILKAFHPIAAYDAWFDQIVQDWGAPNGVATQVDRVNASDLPGRVGAELESGSGHNLIEHVGPLPQFQESLTNLASLVAEASARFGDQAPFVRAATTNPVSGVVHGFGFGYSPAFGAYRQSLWGQVGQPGGPSTYTGLLNSGATLWQELGAMTGLGMAPEPISQRVAEAVIWAHGGSVQDVHEAVTINSPQTLAAVEYMKRIYDQCETPEVFRWATDDAITLLGNGLLSYTPFSVSAYRSLGIQKVEAAPDVFLGAPLAGPAGADLARSVPVAMQVAMIPAASAFTDTAAAFLLHLVANAQPGMVASSLVTFPAFANAVPGFADNGGPLDTDPDVAGTAGKLGVLKSAATWSANPGWPGPTNPMMTEAYSSHLLSTMMAKAARGEMTPADAIAEAETTLNALAKPWRERGIMGPG